MFRARTLGLCSLGLITWSTAAQAVTIFHDDFESELAVAEDYFFSAQPNPASKWIVSNGSLGLANNNFIQFNNEGGAVQSATNPAGNGKFVDMHGSNQSPAITGQLSLKTLLTLTPGQYELSFRVAGSHRRQFTEPLDHQENLAVFVGRQNPGGITFLFNPNIKLNREDAWRTITMPFVVNTTTSNVDIWFQDGFNNPVFDSVGVLLDDVSLITIPEPTTALLVCGGLGMLCLRRPRR